MQINTASMVFGTPRRTVLTVEGVTVEELVFTNFSDRHHKLLWVRKPFDQAIVNEMPNPLFHCDFGIDLSIDTEAKAREEVKQLFVRHYHLV